MSESTNVGSIVGKLKIDSSDWNRELAQAEAKANQLGRANPKIRVDTQGAAKAVTELGAVEAAEKRVSASSGALSRMREQSRAVIIGQAMAERDSLKPKTELIASTQRSVAVTQQDTSAKEKNADANRKVDSTAKQAGGSMHLLYSSLAMLAPAALPLAGTAVAAAGALGALGAAGVLAIVGVKKAMEDGTQTGNRYAAGISVLKTQFQGLANTSAEGTLTGFNRSVNTLDSYMPSLNTQMGAFSRVLGNVAADGLSGVLGLFTTLDPVIRGFAGYLGQLSEKFSAIGQSNGLRSFGDYALATMPLVMATIESLVKGVSNLLQALAPLGSAALTSLKIISDILGGIPTQVLTLLVSGALGAYAAFSAWSALIPIIQSFGLMLNMSLGPIGLIVAGVGALIGVMVGSAASTKDATAATMGYTAALARDNGIIAENVRAHSAQEIAKSKAADSARRLGIDLGLVTQAAIGNKDAQKQLEDQLTKVEAATKASIDPIHEQKAGYRDALVAAHDTGEAISTLRGELGNQSSALQQSVEYQKRFNEAMGETGTVAESQGAKINILAGMYGASVAALAGAEEAERKTAEQLAATTLQMQLQNDAGGLLKMQLDLLSGKTLSFEQAQNSFEKQLISSTQNIQSNGAALDGNGAAAIGNRGNLLQLVQSAQLSAEAFGTMTGSSEQARAKLMEQRNAIIENAVANGMNREAVTKYIDSVMKIPTSIPPTKIQVDTAAAEAALQALTARRTAQIDVIVNRSEMPDLNGPEVSGSGRMGTYAHGGMVNYLATGGFPQFKPVGTDTVPAMLTPGEIVIKKSSVDSIGADKLLHANETGSLPSGGGPTIIVNDTSGDPVSTAYNVQRVMSARQV